MIVADRRNVGQERRARVEDLGFEVAPLSASACGWGRPGLRWGKEGHSASLNFGAGFAYALAESLSAPLLVGDDFAKTDLASG